MLAQAIFCKMTIKNAQLKVGLFVGSITLFLAGCGGGAAPAEPITSEASEVTDVVVVEKEVEIEVEKMVEAAAEEEYFAAEEVMEEAAEEEASEELGEAMDDSSSWASDEEPVAVPTMSPSTVIQQTDPLRAGEIDDNAQWMDYLSYRNNYREGNIHHVDVSERYIIEVIDEKGKPVMDAMVSFYAKDGNQSVQIYGARTYANGRVAFYPQALGMNLANVNNFIVQVERANAFSRLTLSRSDVQVGNAWQQPWQVVLADSLATETTNLDILFLIDATGSMQDEIDKIQSTIFDVASRIEALPIKPDTRYGMVTYRDRGEAFVSKTYQFTDQVTEFHADLSTVFADGGGDYPEALNEGLHDAIHNVAWREENAARLIFLVADAPPHLDYHNDYNYAHEMDQAARMGIKIFPIASSGLDNQGEYIFRQLAQFTQGRFIFLTYDGPTNGGSAGSTTTHHVDSYSVENLDDLLVRLVHEELAFQSPQMGVARTEIIDRVEVATPVRVGATLRSTPIPSEPVVISVVDDRSLGEIISIEMISVAVSGFLGILFLAISKGWLTPP